MSSTDFENVDKPEEPRDSGKIQACSAEKLTQGFSVRKSSRVLTTAEVYDRTPDPSQLGASGMNSSMRSAVVKSFRSGRQGGFDEAGDAQKGVEPITTLSSVRASNMVGLVSTAIGEEDPDKDIKWFLCIPLTNNVKALFVMMIMFAAISLGQYFAAIAANSQSLKADVVSMAVDALSYLGNIFGESSDVPSQRVVLQLFFSMLSLVLLLYFNTSILMESIEIVKRTSSAEEEGEEEGEGVEGKIVIAFACLGLVFDAVCLYAYWYYAKQDAIIEFDEMMKIAEAEGKTMEEAKASISKPEINMLTALLHVSADLMRSTTTFILGCFLLSGTLSPDQQEMADSIVGLMIGATIYLGSIYALYEWGMSFWVWFKSLGDSIEVLCPECNTTIEIQPDKAGHGKAADAFLA